MLRVPVPNLLQPMPLRLSGLEKLHPVLRLGRVSGQVLERVLERVLEQVLEQVLLCQYRGVRTVRSRRSTWTHRSGTTQLSGSTT